MSKSRSGMDASVCPRGYYAATKLFYPFPSAQAIEFAKNVCDGKVAGLDGIKKKSKSSNNYMRVRMVGDINGFTRRHAEQWIDVCSKQKCMSGRTSRTCRPSNIIDDNTSLTINQMAEQQIDELCSRYRPSYPNAEELRLKLLRAGIVPTEQIVASTQTIGLADSNQQFHVSRPSEPLAGIDIVELNA
jgi:hypothetical protein